MNIKAFRWKSATAIMTSATGGEGIITWSRDHHGIPFISDIIGYLL